MDRAEAPAGHALCASFKFKEIPSVPTRRLPFEPAIRISGAGFRTSGRLQHAVRFPAKLGYSNRASAKSSLPSETRDSVRPSTASGTPKKCRTRSVIWLPRSRRTPLPLDFLPNR